jgi:hypothetical protein
MADKILIDKQTFDTLTEGKMDGLYDEVVISRYEYEFYKKIEENLQELQAGIVTAQVGITQNGHRYVIIMTNDEAVEMLMKENVELQKQKGNTANQPSNKKWWKLW